MRKSNPNSNSKNSEPLSDQSQTTWRLSMTFSPDVLPRVQCLLDYCSSSLSFVLFLFLFANSILQYFHNLYNHLLHYNSWCFCCFVFFVFWRFFVLFYFTLSRHERQNRLVHFLENIRRITFRKFSSSPSSWNSYGSFGVTRAKLWNNTKRRNETSVANCRRISVLFCILLSFAVEHSFYSKWEGNWCCC